MNVAVGCFVCGSRVFKSFVNGARDRMFGDKEPFSYELCAKCRLVRQNPQISPKKLKVHYPSSSYYAYQKQTSRGIFDRIRSYLLKHYYQPSLISAFVTLFIPNVPAIPSYVGKGRVLDVGCGTGDTLMALASLGWDVYGLDIDANAVRIARKRGLTNVSKGYYQDIARFPNGFFDAIRLYHVIEHLNDPVGCLTLIRRKLKADGELLVGTPNAASFAAKMFGSFWYNLDAPRHLFLFTPNNLARLVKATGFTVSAVRFCSAGGIVGSLQYLLGVPLLSHAWLVMLVYPIEWILDKIGLGDVFVIRARRS